MTGYEVFCLYQSLKLHFTQDSYDFFKYQGKSKVTIESFENRKDKWHFTKLSRKFSNKEGCIDFLVANFLEDDKVWVGTLLTEEADGIFKQRQKVIQSLSYTFENDCNLLFANVTDPNELLKVIDGEHPLLLKKTMQKVIQIETLCILAKILDFLPMWNSKITDTIIWPLWQSKVIKYSPFIQFDEAKKRRILKNSISFQHS
jgi:hypothetical protein